MKLFLSLTPLFGAFFLSIQAIEYWKLLHEHFNPHVILFGSVFFTTTGFHGFHVFCGVVCMAYVTGKAFSGNSRRRTTRGSRRWACTGTSWTWSGSSCSRSSISSDLQRRDATKLPVTTPPLLPVPFSVLATSTPPERRERVLAPAGLRGSGGARSSGTAPDARGGRDVDAVPRLATSRTTRRSGPSFQGQGPVRTVYFAILISHTVLAALIVPLVLCGRFISV